jgi:hypothetical protein
MKNLLPICGHAAQREVRERRTRRGEREISWPSLLWVCPVCEDPETGEPPLRFSDAALAAINDAALETAWKEQFGESVPTSMAAVRLRDLGFTMQEMAWIEQQRGKQSALEFVRGLVQQDLKKAS